MASRRGRPPAVRGTAPSAGGAHPHRSRSRRAAAIVRQQNALLQRFVTAARWDQADRSGDQLRVEATDGGSDHDAGSNGHPARGLIESATRIGRSPGSPWFTPRGAHRCAEPAATGPPKGRFLGAAHQDTPQAARRLLDGPVGVRPAGSGLPGLTGGDGRRRVRHPERFRRPPWQGGGPVTRHVQLRCRRTPSTRSWLARRPAPAGGRPGRPTGGNDLGWSCRRAHMARVATGLRWARRRVAAYALS